MRKKALILVLAVLIVAGGGVFYWQNQQDVRELNKDLPEGVRVVKSLIGQEYKMVNKIDGYEFKVPREWKGVKEVEYIPEREERGFRGTSINIIGSKREAAGIGIDKFNTEEVTLVNWAKNMFNIVGLVGEFTSDKIKNFEIVKTQENVHLLGMYMYFFKKDTSVYTFTGSSEEFIREIISNGEW